jgi:sulfiredoxin
METCGRCTVTASALAAPRLLEHTVTPDGKHRQLTSPAPSMLWSASSMLKRETFAVADIYVPIKRRATLEQKRLDEIAASMLDSGQQTPILVRADGARFVLVEGLHRLEAAKALGEKTIVGFRVDARKH